jgi:pimeloyl-ACP methyl ester carboxylesterase
VTAGGFRPALAGLRGVVLTSTVTILDSSADQATFNLYAARITVPALVVWHQDDHCLSFSPPAGSAALFEVLPSIDKASASFEGGHSVAQDPCGPFSEHGYAGIEEEVVDEIAEFIRGPEQD